MKKTIKKRIKGNQVIEFNPEENQQVSSSTVKAFESINSNEPLSLQDFLLTLNDRINQEHQS